MSFGNLLAQTSQNFETSLLNRIEPNFLGAILILSVIFGFVIIVVSVVTIFSTIEKITLAKMSKSMVEDMMAKGYSPEEIRMLVQGDRPWEKFRKFFAWSKKKPAEEYTNRPAPPVKQRV